jgi:hypothetical protein
MWQFMDEDRQRWLGVRQTNFLLIFMLCVFQVVVPAWGTVLCVGEDGHVAMRLSASCVLEASGDTCQSSPDAGPCSCCISGEASRGCSDTLVSPYSLSAGSVVPRAPDAHFGGAVMATGVHESAISCVMANSSVDIRNPFLIESAAHCGISSVILLI